jgi:hypothetical protein
MKDLLRIGVSAMVTWTAASVVSTAGLALLAQREGKSAFQPMNATSHWLHGDRAALQHGGDAAPRGERRNLFEDLADPAGRD